MIRVIVYMVPKGEESQKRELGRLEINNIGGTELIGNYKGVLDSEYQKGRKGFICKFYRRNQSVWSLIGAFLKLWGHTKHNRKNMEESISKPDFIQKDMRF